MPKDATSPPREPDSQAPTQDDRQTVESRSEAQADGFFIVGLGASAGGLEPLMDLLRALPKSPGMAFVIVQHLEPHHTSQLPEILSHNTAMRVTQAAENDHIERDRVYVIPPNSIMVVRDRVLHVAARPDSPRVNYPIYVFFSSLAADAGANAVGIVLSGSGSDGAQGVRAIKARFGTTFAQDERSAKFGSMPHCAIATGAVDFVLPSAGIAEELSRLGTHPYLTAPVQQLEAPFSESEGDGEFQEILDKLKQKTHVDFTLYKQSTLRRRLGRRLALHHLTTLREYLEYLDAQPGEISELYREILINVTAFFRDPGVFDSLAAAISEYLQNRGKNDPLRVWVPGCATGEEAYSLAIACFEILERTRNRFPIQLFGTDISDFAIDQARTGIYSPTAVTGLSRERLQHCFSRIDSGYQIKQHIRDTCIFARHDITRDPPFSQMDVVSCRNVFIYLTAGLQQRVLPSLHYSLKPSGLLVLGSAETPGERSDLFGIVDAENRIYVKKPGPVHLPLDTLDGGAAARRVGEGQSTPPGTPPSTPATPNVADIESRAARILRDLYAPAGVLINEEFQILHFHGNVEAYLGPIPSEAAINLLRVAPEDLLGPLRRAAVAAFERKEPVHEPGVQLNIQGHTTEIQLTILPVFGASPSYLILFEEPPPADVAAKQPEGAKAAAGTELELSQTRRELTQTKDYLRRVIEQQEAANEELRSANEEVHSSNEELQSTNEEMRTAKEQLQSLNEELTTLNDELQNRNRELNATTDDLTNILSASTIPIVMVDRNLRIRRFTPAAERLLQLSPADLGKRVSDVHCAVKLPELSSKIEETLRTLAVEQEQVQDREGHWFSFFVRPYRTSDEKIEGAVLTFIDVDEATRALERVEQALRFADGIIETVQHPLLVLDSSLRVKRATNSFYKTFGVTAEETLERGIDDLGNQQWNIPELRRLLEQALVRDVPFGDFEVTHEFPHIGRRVMRLNARRIVAKDQNFTVLLAIEDITDRRNSAEIQFRGLFESAKDGILVLSAERAKVIDVNPAFLEMCLYPAKDLVGKPFTEIAPFLADGQIRGLVNSTLDKGTTRYESVTLRGADGRELIVEMIANSYRVKEQPALIQVNIRDVTERRHDEARLRSANMDLQQFAFAASHDLQEPLRAVTLYAELLKRDFQDKLSPPAPEYMEFILNATERMRQLVLDLLGYSQVVRADLILNEVNMEAALGSAELNLQLAIQSSGAVITFDPLPVVRADETRMVQLLQNLLSNAIKYHGKEPPRIHLSAREAGTEWIFSVRDNGVGIEPQYAEQIFAVFKRLHGPEQPGTGVGLAICKKIIERRGGRIWVESVPGEGSTFFFTVPKEGQTGPA